MRGNREDIVSEFGEQITQALNALQHRAGTTIRERVALIGFRQNLNEALEAERKTTSDYALAIYRLLCLGERIDAYCANADSPTELRQLLLPRRSGVTYH